MELTLTIEYRDEHERLALEQAIAYIAHFRQVAQGTPDGTVLAACEQLALAEGRALLRSTSGAALEGRIDAAEQEGRPASVPWRTPDASGANAGRPVLTAVAPSPCGGLISVAIHCGQGAFGADRILGVEGYVSQGACRMACLWGCSSRSPRPS